MNTFVVCSLLAIALTATGDRSNYPHKTDMIQLPFEVPSHTVVQLGNGSMCMALKHKSPPPPASPPTCQWNCQQCGNTCVSGGYRYYCCQAQWCCCYASAGNCARSGANCWENDCPHS